MPTTTGSQTEAAGTTAGGSITSKLPWPPGTPTSMKVTLSTMAVHDELNGISPQIIAAIAQAESGFEDAGAGVNSEGYGGYFGLGATHHYAAGTPSRSLLETHSTDSLRMQAKIAAGDLGTYFFQAQAASPTAKTETLMIAAVNHYVNGGSFKDFSSTATLDAKLVAGVISGATGEAIRHIAITPTHPTKTGTAGGAQPTNLLWQNSLGGFFSKLSAIENVTLWRRIGIFLGGAALCGVGVAILARKQAGELAPLALA